MLIHGYTYIYNMFQAVDPPLPPAPTIGGGGGGGVGGLRTGTYIYIYICVYIYTGMILSFLRTGKALFRVVVPRPLPWRRLGQVPRNSVEWLKSFDLAVLARLPGLRATAVSYFWYCRCCAQGPGCSLHDFPTLLKLTSLANSCLVT